jgi:tRNA(Ile)-lysidine synthase
MPANGHRLNSSVPAAHPEPVANFNPLNGRSHVALAVSGGSDSIAMLRLVAAWCERNPNPPRLSILTVDHGLRPESAAEAQRVHSWAAGLGLSHHVLRWEGVKPRSGLQAKARNARYDLMTAWCRRHDAGLLLTAHTLDDQAETVLMRLDRTSSPDSLAGIPETGTWNGVDVFRPVLGVRRELLRDYLRSLGQAWVEDPSNEDLRFERVRLRKRLGQEADVRRLAALAAQCRQTVERLDSCTDRWIADWLKETPFGICYLPLNRFLPLPGALQSRILGRIVGHYGGGAKVERSELDRLAAWAAEEGPIRRTLGGAVVGKRLRELWITREPARIRSEPCVIANEGFIVWDGRFVIAAPEGSAVTPSGVEGQGWPESHPVHARQSYPLVRLPEGASGEAKVEFLGLNSLNGTFTPLASLEIR